MILHVPLQIWLQMQEYVTASLPNEVTGIGAIRILNPNEVKVTEIFLPQQSVSAGYSQFAKGELGRIISKFVGNNPACAGLFPSLLEIIQHVLEICVSVGILMPTVVFFGRALTKTTSTAGKGTTFLI